LPHVLNPDVLIVAAAALFSFGLITCLFVFLWKFCVGDVF
jgi:hypothetical protein